ncbi:MAG: hypothetical protein CL868_21000 [Cytophagaceae bacterium]|nr:hypothetical protein [Cytophagaceae bacterium]|tara:strand:- start:52 stop:558 length:507 start_codon:yes stop_codon:yes gene_type:complete
MSINTLNISALPKNSKLNNQIKQFNTLVAELNKKKIPQKFIDFFNVKVHDLNTLPVNKALRKKIKTTETIILKIVAKECELYVKHHNRNIWLALGMTAFGLPIGAAFGIIFGAAMGVARDDMSKFALGLPIGLGAGMGIGIALGIAIGGHKDKKVEQQGKQLDIEIKY